MLGEVCNVFYRPLVLQVTAAGDQLARLWDVKSGELLGSFKGHLCSLKSVAFSPEEKGVLSLPFPLLL